MSSTTNHLSSNQLRQALQLSEQIESLQQRLDSLLGGGGSSTTSSSVKSTASGSPLKGRKLSPATLRKMRAAQQARWAKIKGPSAKSQGAAKFTAAPASKKEQLSP